jgi:23S rRNA (cytidine1920-2'-O)/16S rRNA (cytidine1409-2'-O)-methyltransferase
MDFVSRAGQKLHHALQAFAVSPAGLVCADLGSNTGGFVDCMLQLGATKVYAVDTGYGVLDYKLRKDPRVVVMERTNAMHVSFPEPVDLVSIDVAWTKQKFILPSARRLVKPDGRVVTLIKPHYEADPKLLKKGILPEDEVAGVVDRVKGEIETAGFDVLGITDSPIKGAQGNRELLAHLRPRSS